MHSFRSSGADAKSRLVSLVAVAVIALTTAPAVMAADAAEETISVQRVGRHQDILSVVTTRLFVPVQAQWEADPDAGPLTLTVERGALGVLLSGGSARIERRTDPLQGGQIGPLPPGRQTVLWPGDQLVIVRGFQLTVTNDEDEPASAIVMQYVRQYSAPTADGAE